MKNQPTVSVIMAAYNSAEFLAESVQSILDQTFEEFELIIVNDGSTDNSKKIIESFKDDRIKLITQKNQGPVAARNRAIKESRGEYVAVMDADDIAVVNRLELEVAMMKSNPNLGAVGSNYTAFDDTGEQWTTNVFTHPDDLKTCMVLCNQFGHASVMFRKSVLDVVGLYSSETGGIVEDYDLLIRVSHVADLANIEKPLLKWRKSAGSITHSNFDKQVEDTLKLRDREFRRFMEKRGEYSLFGINPSGKNYFTRKSMLYRDFAYLYNKNGHKLKALFMMVCAAICQPLNKRNYKRTILLFNKGWFGKYWEYEFL